MCGAIWIDTHGTIRNYSVDTINYNKPGGTVRMAAPDIAVLSLCHLSLRKQFSQILILVQKCIPLV